MNPETQISDWIRDRLNEAEWASFFLIELQVDSRNKVDVFLDGDQGITLDVCRNFSRYLEEKLDASGLLGDAYTLEVSSPGASRPLMWPRQYAKHVGRTLEVSLQDGSRAEGKLLALTEAGISIGESVKVKGRKSEVHERMIHFADIRHSVVKLSFH